MAHEFLSDFLSRLQDAGELVRIAAPVDTGLEVAAITDRVCKSSGGGPALLFERPKSSSIPVVTNLLGSQRRLCLALGVDSLDQLAESMTQARQPESNNWLEALKLAPMTSGLSRYSPRVIKTAVCQQVVKLGRDVNLWDLPIPRCWPGEANPVITSALFVTPGLVAGTRNVTRFPVQVIGQQQLVPHWHRHHACFREWQAAVREQKQLPVAITLGGDPVQSLMTQVPVVSQSETLQFGGLLRGAAFDLVRGRSVELDVPAAAEIVIEGYIDYAVPPAEAPPIASGSGHYLPAEHLPIIQVTAITHRANPLFPAMIPATPPSEESWITLAIERISLAIAKSTIPEIVDIHLPFAGAGRNLLFVSIRKEDPLQARKVLNALWGSSLLGLTKMVIVVDADVNVKCESDVWFAVGSQVNPSQDLIVTEGPTHMDDHTTLHRGVGHKVGIDATRKLPEESLAGAISHPMKWTDELPVRLKERWREFGLPDS